jgi:hypothetical protein
VLLRFGNLDLLDERHGGPLGWQERAGLRLQRRCAPT